MLGVLDAWFDPGHVDDASHVGSSQAQVSITRVLSDQHLTHRYVQATGRQGAYLHHAEG